MKNTGAVLVEDIPAPHESTFEHSTFSFKIALKNGVLHCLTADVILSNTA